MRTIEIKRIGHQIKPVRLSEQVVYTIDLIDQLDGDTIDSKTFTIIGSRGDVTADFAKDSSMSGTICSIGVLAYATGRYTITLWFTCNEYLPDGATKRKFKVELILTIK